MSEDEYQKRKSELQTNALMLGRPGELPPKWMYMMVGQASHSMVSRSYKGYARLCVGELFGCHVPNFKTFPAGKCQAYINLMFPRTVDPATGETVYGPPPTQVGSEMMAVALEHLEIIQNQLEAALEENTP